ncbi:hypothetical protein GCM10027051_19950 [Niabella terrae]
MAGKEIKDYKQRLLYLLVLLCLTQPATAQTFYPIWENAIPDQNGIAVTDSVVNERIWQVATPGIYAFEATRAENTGTAVMICPGGGYQRASYVYNGFNFARWFNTLGINVYVLIYRQPHQRNLVDGAKAPLQDAQQAMAFIRSHAADWNLKDGKIGVMGISAGGHLAAMLSAMQQDIRGGHGISQSFRPDFAVLLSPVITMGPWAHSGSRRNLLGADTSAARIRMYSAENQVTTATAPSFIVHAVNDKTVNIHNSLLYYQALIDHGVAASLHSFPQGGHGIRLTENPGSTELWLPLLHAWLKEMNFLNPLPFK